MPSRAIEPLVGGIHPAMIPSSVLFPEPDGPVNA
jgi:hypothetical protein